MLEFKFGSVDDLRGALVAVRELFMGPSPSCTVATSIGTVVRTYETAPVADEEVDDDGDVATVPETPVAAAPSTGRKRGRKPKAKEPEVAGGNTPVVSDDQLPPSIGPTGEAAKEIADKLADVPEPEADATEQSTPATEATSMAQMSTLDIASLRAMCIKAKDAIDAVRPNMGMEEVTNVLRKYGGERAHLIPEDQMAACYAELEALANG